MIKAKDITLFYKALTIIDAAILDQQFGLMGQSWYLDVKLTGNIDNESVIADFSKIKQKIKNLIDLEVDHRLIVEKSLIDEKDESYFLKYTYAANKSDLEYLAPKESICLLEKPFTIEILEQHLTSLISKVIPQNVSKVECTLREESNELSFHYTHGLKQHYGNCQRLFHGHKNTIEIFLNGERKTLWEKRLINEVFKGNIHFAFRENLVTRNTDSIKESKYFELEYVSSQGRYNCKLPREDVYIMPCETTIENISQYFACWIKTNWAQTNDVVEVVAYEGIGKGARFKAN